MPTFGITSISGAAPDYNPVNRVRASLSTIPVDGYVYKLTAYIKGETGFGAPQKIRLCTYENSAGT